MFLEVSASAVPSPTTVPCPTTQARIRLVATDTAWNVGQDNSNGTFTIVSAGGGVVSSTLRDFEFAGVSVGSAPANFMADAVGSLDMDEIAGNIGAAMLRSFVLVFDCQEVFLQGTVQWDERTGYRINDRQAGNWIQFHFQVFGIHHSII